LVRKFVSKKKVGGKGESEKINKKGGKGKQKRWWNYEGLVPPLSKPFSPTP
jgi:hypothetical protein